MNDEKMFENNLVPCKAADTLQALVGMGQMAVEYTAAAASMMCDGGSSGDVDRKRALRQTRL